MANNEEYDLKNFSDEELFHLMDLNDPTDRELEAKIYSLIDKYGANNSKPSLQMYKFFTDVFLHFFSSDDDNIEGFEGRNKSEKSVVIEPPKPPVSTVTSNYSKGLLNPILKDTIKRIVCIDSQHRDLSLYPNSCSFTFNLSDTLTDVVSIKLYSIQIPYTWYTISNDFGSNFFILKGITEGINIGNYDIKVQIESGNYQSVELADSINASFLNLSQELLDVDFGSTMVSYNTINSKLTLTIDIKVLYNETNYKLEFPTVASGGIMNSIQYLLGYSQQVYYPFTAISSKFIDSSGTIIPYIPSKMFRITNRNNKFSVYVYESSIENSKILSIKTLDLTNNIFDLSNNNVSYKTMFTITMSLFGWQEASAIVSDVQNQILLCPYIDPQKSSLVYDGTLFRLNIRLNRKKVPNGQNYKSVIVFKDPPVYNPIWKGPNSLFMFSNNVYDLNRIVSENNNLNSYDVLDSCYISFITKNPAFSEFNKYVYIVEGNYTLALFAEEVNLAFQNLKQNTMNSFDCSLNYNLTSSATNVTHITSVVNFTIPYYRTPAVATSSIKNFVLKPFTGSIIGTVFGFDAVNINKNPQTFVQTFSNDFYFTGTNINIPVIGDYISVRMVNTDNSFSFSKDYTLLDYRVSGYTLQDIDTSMNQFFSNHVDASYNVSFVDSKISFTPNNTQLNLYTCQLKLVITVLLINKDYNLQLSEDNIWNSVGFKNLENNTYDMSLNPIIGTSIETEKTIILDDSNNYFTLGTIADINVGGVHRDNGENDIKIKLTLSNGTYLRGSIVENINTVLRNNPVTNGSYFTMSNGKTIFYMNINKTFTTQDYSLIFFDSTFTKCNFGRSFVENVKWDTTLGWILGFRNQTDYKLKKSYETFNESSFYYDVYPNQVFTVDSETNVVMITGDTSINVNLYNYFLLAMDDYCQNHLNDGLVTVTKTDYDIPLPSYANRTTYICDASSGQLSVVNGKLTSKQLYSANQLLNTKQINQKSSVYSSGPFTQDIFAVIPMKNSGLKFGQSYVDFSGTLQNQERTYFGPVNVRKMTIQLLNDKGGTLNLNGADWSFSLIVEQLYNPSRN